MAKNKTIPKESDVGGTKLICTNDGFVSMVEEGTEVAFGALSIVKEISTGVVPENFKKGIDYGYTGVMGMGNWLGYILAAAFYLGEEFGFGQDLCDAFGYGYLIIDNLHVLVSFMPK